jgi:disulfide bond formation protein DsbB
MSVLKTFLDTWTRPDRWPLVAALGSALILAGAYAFEIFGNYPPCPLCIDQRWVHIWIIIAGVAGFAAARLLRRPDAQLVKTGAEAMRGWFRTRLQALYALYQAPGALARVASFIMAVLFGWSAYEAGRHAGMEYGFWYIDCQIVDGVNVTSEDLLAALSTPQNVALCDEVVWSLLGISMAGYNFLFSVAMGLISLAVLFRGPSWRPDL